MSVYILHLSEKMGHAQHYVGYAEDVEARLDEHAATTWEPYEEPSYAEGKRKLGEKHGPGATFMGVVNSRGISYVLARVWEDGDQRLEKLIKSYKKTALLCPLCNDRAMNYLNMESVQ